MLCVYENGVTRLITRLHRCISVQALQSSARMWSLEALLSEPKGRIDVAEKDVLPTILFFLTGHGTFNVVSPQSSNML